MKFMKANRAAGFVVFAMAACGLGGENITTEQQDFLKRLTLNGKKTKTPPLAPSAPSAVLITTAQKNACVAPVASSNFSIILTYDVWVEAEYANLISGSHVQTTRFYEPRGMLWQETTVGFSTASTCVVDGKFQIWDSLPVAGTAIQNYWLAGIWRVDAHLDNAASPIASATFTLY